MARSRRNHSRSQMPRKAGSAPLLGFATLLASFTALASANVGAKTAPPRLHALKSSHVSRGEVLEFDKAHAASDGSQLSLESLAISWNEAMRPHELLQPLAFDGRLYSVGGSDIASLNATASIGTDVDRPPSESRQIRLAPAAPVRQQVRQPRVFGSVAIKTSSAALRATVGDSINGAEWKSEGVCADAGNPASCAVELPKSWQSFVEELRDVSLEEVVKRVDAEVNSRIRYANDRNLNGVRDHWSKPSETLQRAAGDCEDFAILKMWLLAVVGVPLDDMHIVVVRNAKLSSDHAILQVHANGTDYILDSLVKQVRRAERVKDYQPVYSVNSRGFWLHAFASEATHTVARQ